MGTGPDAPPPSLSERAELLAVQQLTMIEGWTVTDTDDGQTHRAPDAEFVAADGSLGALEVTILGDERDLQATQLLLGETIDPGGLEFFWEIHVRPPLRVRGFAERIVEVLHHAEAVGHEAGFLDLSHDSDLEAWYDRIDVKLYRRHSEPAVRIITVPSLAFWPESAAVETQDRWVAANVHAERLSRKITKLADTGRPHQHLFVVVDFSAADDQALGQLFHGTAVPTIVPELPETITDLWLAHYWGADFTGGAATVGSA